MDRRLRRLHPRVRLRGGGESHFLFGLGITLGSGCGSKTLVRVGGGNLKSVIVFDFLGQYRRMLREA